jgi:hypothetical protein
MDDPWYIANRGELLAEQFLLDLNPVSLFKVPIETAPIDFFITFRKLDGGMAMIGVEIKSTQTKVGESYHFHSTERQIRYQLKSNIPILFILADVKRNKMFFNWLNHVEKMDPPLFPSREQTFSIPLREATTEERQKLLEEILHLHFSDQKITYSKTTIKTDDVDTIVVSVKGENFENFFMKDKLWYAILISPFRLKTIKYIAVYRTAPISAITHYGEIARIEKWKDTSKYIVYLKGNPIQIETIILDKNKKGAAPRGPRYTSLNRLLNARVLSEVF